MKKNISAKRGNVKDKILSKGRKVTEDLKKSSFVAAISHDSTAEKLVSEHRAVEVKKSQIKSKTQMNKNLEPKKMAGKTKGNPSQKALSSKSIKAKKSEHKKASENKSGDGKAVLKKIESKSQTKKIPDKNKISPDILDIAKKIEEALPKKSSKKADKKTLKSTDVSPKKKSAHVRHSLSIYFSMADLDAYLDRRKDTTFSVSETRATSTAKIVGKDGAKKVVAVEKSANEVVEVASIEDLLGFNLFEQPSRQKVEEKDIPKKWKKFYSILMDMRKRYSSGAESRAEEVLKRSAKEDSGDLSSYGQHLADAGSESFERDMAYNLLSTEKEMIREIDDAIQRMKNGTYGICELTGNPIPEKRLLAVPFTRYTLEGQSIKDKENAAKRRLSGGTQNAAFGDLPEASTSESEES